MRAQKSCRGAWRDKLAEAEGDGEEDDEEAAAAAAAGAAEVVVEVKGSRRREGKADDIALVAAVPKRNGAGLPRVMGFDALWLAAAMDSRRSGPLVVVVAGARESVQDDACIV